MLFQALWNYIIDSGNVIGALGEEEADYLSADILECLGWYLLPVIITIIIKFSLFRNNGFTYKR